jgi:CDP-diacylglycerol--glycerol-3-phosphate 3-phosphatidyltransferase
MVISTDIVGSFVKTLVPQRFIEGFGLQHMKCYGFDDEVIISGYFGLTSANLNDDYFKNRQDRYVSFASSTLSQYFDELIGLVSSFSFKGTHDGLQSPPMFRNSPFHGNKQFKERFQIELNDFLDNWFHRTRKVRDELDEAVDDATVFVAPTLQLHPLKICQDERSLLHILGLGSSSPSYRYHMLTGYFNLPSFVTKYILKSQASFNMITSSPEANGFFGSSGVSRWIPHVYSYLEQLFLKKVKASNQQHRIKMYEYKREKWTWHCKGVWLKSNTGDFLTVLGSSNMNFRSFRRDLEAQVVLFTRNKSVIGKFEANLDYLYQDSNLVDLPAVSERDIPPTIRVLSRIMRDMF